jgi:hypothetical protein
MTIKIKIKITNPKSLSPYQSVFASIFVIIVILILIPIPPTKDLSLSQPRPKTFPPNQPPFASAEGTN